MDTIRILEGNLPIENVVKPHYVNGAYCSQCTLSHVVRAIVIVCRHDGPEGEPICNREINRGAFPLFSVFIDHESKALCKNLHLPVLIAYTHGDVEIFIVILDVIAELLNRVLIGERVSPFIEFSIDYNTSGPIQ